MVSYTIRKEFKDSILERGWRFNGQRWFCPNDHLDVKALTVPSVNIKNAEQIFTLQCQICDLKVEDEVELKKLSVEGARD
jgi:transcription elongation factor Elf1